MRKILLLGGPFLAGLLSFSFVLWFQNSVSASEPEAFPTVQVQDDAIRFLAPDGEAVFLIDGLKFNGELKFASCRETEDGFQLELGIPEERTELQKASARLTEENGKVTIHFQLVFSDTKNGRSVNPWNVMVRRRSPLSMGKAGKLEKPVFWERPTEKTASGTSGTPFERSGGTFARWRLGKTEIWEKINGNANWRDPWAQHLTVKQVENAVSRTFEGTAEFLLTAPRDGSTVSAESVSAWMGRGELLGLTVSSSQPFHLWKPGETPNFTIRADSPNIQLPRGRKLPKMLQIRWTVRDFDGKIAAQGTEKRADFAQDPVFAREVTLPADLPRGVYFLDVSASGFIPRTKIKTKAFGQETGGQTPSAPKAFARTTFGILPDYEFQHRERSIFGLAASFNVPSESDVFRLMDRMGVRWLRNGDTRVFEREFGGIANSHEGISRGKFQNEPQEKAEWIRGVLGKMAEQKNFGWELGNEWNMTKLESGETADEWTHEWLLPVWKARENAGPEIRKIQIFSLGLAGPDLPYLRSIAENGGWPMLDGVCLHPGRGNITPDCLEGYWSFLGAIRRTKKQMAELDEKYPELPDGTPSRTPKKPLFLTETYACTRPHHFWYDSQRQAAENVVLSHVLAMAEGISGVFWYQLHDSVWHNVSGMNENDNEYFYGLLDRHGAVKPSFIAYCTISEALDGAEFRKYGAFSVSGMSDSARGQEPGIIKYVTFDTPRGPLAVLWSRADGYVQSKAPGKGESFVTPEPWEDHWKTVLPVRLAVSKKFRTNEVIVLDCLGREIAIAALKKGTTSRIEVPLTGAPFLIYGLDLQELEENSDGKHAEKERLGSFDTEMP